MNPIIIDILLLVGFVIGVNAVLGIVSKILVVIIIAVPARFCGVWQEVVVVILIIVNILISIGSIWYGVKLIF